MLKRIRELLARRGRRSPTPAAGPGAAAAAAPPVHRGPRVVHHPIPHADLDPDAVKIIQRLTRFDHTAYLVGGCVRDLLLARKPKDFDVGTSATPRQIKRLFRNCRIIGRRFRLAHIYFQNGKIIEVATFRARDVQDGLAEAGEDLLIRDDNVFGTAEEDALRRDFTINSLFYDVNAEAVLDHAEGLDDLRRRLVRTIGDPLVRLREDPVRSLRAVKFAARLGFELEPATLAALHSTRADLARAAPPRILEEINRFGREGAARRSMEMLRDTGLLEQILPEITASTRGAAWDLLGALLEHFDRAREQGAGDVRTGQILAVLLVPGLLLPAGSHRAGGGFDAALRSIALRLRVPRREVEHCRHIVAALARLGRAARGGRPAPRRDGMDEARWMHEILARHGVAPEQLAAALAGATATDAAPTSSAPDRAEGAADGEPGVRRRRRRSRRGGRGRRSPAAPTQASDEPTAAPAAPAPRSATARRRDLPPVWDDNYFFAALPSAPEEESDPAPGTEATGVTEAADTEPAGVPAAAAAPEAPAPRPQGRRRRRRRGRRGGASRGAGGAAVGTALAGVETAVEIEAEDDAGGPDEEQEP